MKIKKIPGNIVDVLNREIYPGTLEIMGGRIRGIVRENREYRNFIIPGFVDSHMHIESSMLTPSEFARAVLGHGTVAVISDPHEMANILGMQGIKYLIEDAKNTPMKIYFSAPSCVPSTIYETSGAVLGHAKIEELMGLEEIKCLGEVMNYPGVINDDPELIKKINAAKKHSKPVDGHAPGLGGKNLRKYIKAGISTDHECTSRKEALEKIRYGMKIQIREGSAAKNLEELMPLIEKHPGNCMLCSDDKHPNDLARGYLNDMVKKTLEHGIDLMDILQVASVNPTIHYNLDVGLLRAGDRADFLVIDNLERFSILETYINGEKVAEENRTQLPYRKPGRINNFNTGKKKILDFKIPCGGDEVNVIEVIEDQIITRKTTAKPKTEEGYAISDTTRDILKITVVNRYQDTKPAVGFIKNFKLREGAIASSIAHDAHNIIAVGVSDRDICRAVNLVIEHGGGISAVSEGVEKILPLPVAGIISDQEHNKVAEKYTELDNTAKKFGSRLQAPYMTLPFMAVLVIPEIKISDRGLFDVEKFRLIDVFEQKK